MRKRQEWSTAGFSLVELVVAILILTVGLLGLAGGTAYVIRSVTLTEMNTKRSAALQGTIEQLRAIPFDSIRSDGRQFGSYRVEWVAVPSGVFGGNSKQVTITTVGPGAATGQTGAMPILTSDASQSFTYVIMRR